MTIDSHTRTAFTLLEVLAALVLLGLLAVAAVPILRHLATNQRRLPERLSALETLLSADQTGQDDQGPDAPAIETAELDAPPGLPGEDLALRLPRRWVRVSIHQDGRTQAAALRLLPGWPASVPADSDLAGARP